MGKLNHPYTFALIGFALAGVAAALIGHLPETALVAMITTGGLLIGQAIGRLLLPSRQQALALVPIEDRRRAHRRAGHGR